MQKPVVFISHITEEKDVAIALKEVIESAFIGMMEVFVSSDPLSIKLGHKWLEKITDALDACAIEIIIASPQSVKRPWINFEAGAGWIRKVPVIPICHSGLVPNKLPPPLGTLQAATATEADELKLILPVLAEALNSGIPKIDFCEFVTKVHAFEKDSKLNAQMTVSSNLPETDGLAAHEFATLVAIAENSNGSWVAIHQVRTELESYYRPIAISLALKMLERKELVTIDPGDESAYNSYPTVEVTDPGWVWLQMNQDKLELKKQQRKYDESNVYEDAGPPPLGKNQTSTQAIEEIPF